MRAFFLAWQAPDPILAQPATELPPPEILSLVRQRVIYHVQSVKNRINGRQGIFLTGMRVTLHGAEIPGDSSRFRKVGTQRDHAPHKRRRRQPAAMPG